MFTLSLPTGLTMYRLFWRKPIFCDGLALEVTTSQAGSTTYAALYDMDLSASPVNRLVHTAITTTSTGVQVGTFTATYIPAGIYLFAIWSDAAVVFTANSDATWMGGIQLGLDPSNPEKEFKFSLINSQTSLTELPDPATAPSGGNNYTHNLPICFVRAT